MVGASGNNVETGSGQTTRSEFPPPNPHLDEALDIDFGIVVDLLADPTNERNTFTAKYKNVDYLLDDYREKLQAILEVQHN